MNAASFFIIIVIVVAVFDFWIIAKKGKQASISAWIIQYSKKFPILPLLLGIVLGHLTWSMSDFDWMTKEQIVSKCKKYLEDNVE